MALFCSFTPFTPLGLCVGPSPCFIPSPTPICLKLGSLPLSDLHSFLTGAGGTLMWHQMK